MKMNTTQIKKARVRAKVQGTEDRPRLSVRITNKHIIAQVIDDHAGSTLAYVTTIGKKDVGAALAEKAVWAGENIADAAKKKKINKVVFDRGTRIYHGNLKALAEAARSKGLEF